MQPQPAVHQLTDRDQIQALAHPLRMKVIDALREPDSAAAVARHLDRPRQQVNYHLKELARVGLLRAAGERRKGNFIEQLYQSIARRFVISSRFAWDQNRLEQTLRDQISLSQLADLGERLQSDATELIDAAMEQSIEVPSATTVAELCFPDEAARAAFLNDYTASLRSLLNEHASPTGTPYRVIFAAYPQPDPLPDPQPDPEESDP